MLQDERDARDMAAALIAHVERGWSELMPGLAAKAVDRTYDCVRIFAASPRPLHEPALLSMTIAAIVDPQNYCRPDAGRFDAQAFAAAP